MSHEITPWLQLRPLTPSSSEKSTEVKVFMENGVRGRAQTAGANSRRGVTKKARDFTQPLLSGRCYGTPEMSNETKELNYL